MKFQLGFIVLLIPCVWGAEEQYSYKGFTSCGSLGWQCDTVNKETTYACTKSDPNARVWLWTARIPSYTKTLTVQNCDNVQIHFDCTRGYRSYTLSELRLVNISRVKVLPLMRPGVYLHDNDDVYQAPPSLFLQRIDSINFPPSFFLKPGGTCRYKDMTITKLDMEDVQMPRVMTGSLEFSGEQEVQLLMNRVTIFTLHARALKLNGEMSINDSRLYHVQQHAIQVKSNSRISITNTNITQLEPRGMDVTGQEIVFKGNIVHELQLLGLAAMAPNVQIVNNTFSRLTKEQSDGSFEAITPGINSVAVQQAIPFVYNFSSNVIINPGNRTLQMNASSYFEMPCFQIVVKNNVIEECTCEAENATFLSGDKRFVNEVLKPENNNKCKTCPITTLFDKEHKCKPTPEVARCLFLGIDFKTDAVYPDYSDYVYSTEAELNYTGIEETEKVVQPKSEEHNSGTVWAIVVVTLVIIAAVATAATLGYIHFVRKRKDLSMRYISSQGEDVMLVDDH